MSAMELAFTMIQQGLDILLAPGMISQYFIFNEKFPNYGLYFDHSVSVGYLQSNIIAAKVWSGRADMFAYFKCFSVTVWISLLITIVFISVISAIMRMVKDKGHVAIRCRVYLVIDYLWNYSITLLYGAMSEQTLLSTSRSMIALWLLSAMFISIEFMAFTLDFMVTTLPDIQINTLEDLANRKDMKIIVRNDSALAMYVTNTDTELTKSLRKKMLGYVDMEAEDIAAQISEGLIEGTAAFINRKSMILFHLAKISRSQNVTFDNINLSQESSIYEPFFILYNRDIDPWKRIELDKM